MQCFSASAYKAYCFPLLTVLTRQEWEVFALNTLKSIIWDWRRTALCQIIKPYTTTNKTKCVADVGLRNRLSYSSSQNVQHKFYVLENLYYLLVSILVYVLKFNFTTICDTTFGSWNSPLQCVLCVQFQFEYSSSLLEQRWMNWRISNQLNTRWTLSILLAAFLLCDAHTAIE